jgi:hypothetical protein
MRLLKIKKSSYYLAILFVSVNLSLTSCSESSIENPCIGENCGDVNLNNNENANIGDETIHIGVASTNDKKVYMHYLPWFGEGENGRHWDYGTVNKPLIGYYDSKSWATHLYHILLSSAVGIDGAVINVRTDYDLEAFKAFVASLKRVEEVYADFDYSISISYDDQDMTEASLRAKMIDLKNNTIASTTKYLYKDGAPVIFIWDYKIANSLTPIQYRSIADEVFIGESPILLKNEIEENAAQNAFVMNSAYPWIQGFDNGVDPGGAYLNWFYNTSIDFELNNKVEFVTGAVWPGFDDRAASWGQNRWIDRRNGDLYNDTWNKITSSSGAIDWVILETWNDFNEGSELEPIEGPETECHKYMELTANNIATYKNTTSNIDAEQFMFKAPIKIYEAAKMIENGTRDYDTFYPKLKSAIEKFLQKNGEESFDLAEEITGGQHCLGN